MLRYRESLGLLPVTQPARHGHRQFTERDVETVAEMLALERRFDIGPVALAFGLRVLTEPTVRVALAGLAERSGRLGRARELDFEQQRAQRMLAAAPRPGTRTAPRASPAALDTPRPGPPPRPVRAPPPTPRPAQRQRDATAGTPDTNRRPTGHTPTP
jgi:DNA-binding transcriptional MerR regulator